jgi:hypothetical protein
MGSAGADDERRRYEEGDQVDGLTSELFGKRSHGKSAESELTA